MASSVPRKPARRASSALCSLLGAADEADRGHAVAVAVERVLGGGDERRVVGEAEVVVGAEVQHAAAGLGVDAAGLRRGDDALGLPEAVGADLVELDGEAGGEAVGHGGPPCCRAHLARSRGKWKYGRHGDDAGDEGRGGAALAGGGVRRALRRAAAGDGAADAAGLAVAGVPGADGGGAGAARGDAGLSPGASSAQAGGGSMSGRSRRWRWRRRRWRRCWSGCWCPGRRWRCRGGRRGCGC